MPGVSASVPEGRYAKMREMGISPSKAINMGLDVIFKYGGFEKLQAHLNEIEKIKQDNDDLIAITDDMKDRIKHLKEELEFCRKELIKQEKKARPEKKDPVNREDPGDRLLDEVKKESGE